MNSQKSWLSAEIEDYKLLLKSVPALVTTAFILSTVLMNLMANKVIWQHGAYIAADGGLLLSWLVFLVMDVVTKRFGPKAAIKLNILGVIVNLLCVGLFSIVVAFPGNGEDFSAFNYVFGSTWFIVFGSMVAFFVSGVANAWINFAIGKMFKKNPDSKAAFFCRSYVSTFLAQWIDNFLFAFIVFVIFAPIYWGWGYTIWLAIGTGAVGAGLELAFEFIFGSIGYRMVSRWKDENVGAEWIEVHKDEII